MLKLKWAIEGDIQLVRNLRGVGEGVKDWTPAFKEAAENLKKVFSVDVFRTEGQVIGEKWAPLKPTYLAQKVKQGFPEQTLIKRGILRSSFQSETGKDYAIITNSSPYFKYHQSKAPRSKLPRRIMMKLGSAQKTMVVKVFHTYWYKKTHPK